LRHVVAREAVMTETTYRQVFTRFLNEYWGAFHEVLEAQSVNPHWLAPPLFDAVAAAHAWFATRKGFVEPGVDRLGTLWRSVAERRASSPDAPLTAREITYARDQFETVYDALMARGKVFPRAADDTLQHATHGYPGGPLHADAAR
jgi:hypothetical protein